MRCGRWRREHRIEPGHLQAAAILGPNSVRSEIVVSDPIISLSDFKSDASQWLKRLQDESDAVVLTQNGRASAVVQSYETFQRQQQALLMLKLLAQGEADIAAGRLIPQEEVFAKLRERFTPDA